MCQTVLTNWTDCYNEIGKGFRNEGNYWHTYDGKATVFLKLKRKQQKRDTLRLGIARWPYIGQNIHLNRSRHCDYQWMNQQHHLLHSQGGRLFLGTHILNTFITKPQLTHTPSCIIVSSLWHVWNKGASTYIASLNNVNSELLLPDFVTCVFSLGCVHVPGGISLKTTVSKGIPHIWILLIGSVTV